MFVTYPSFNCYWAPSSLRVFVATNTFISMISGGMFSFIWANYLYPEGPAVMHLQDGILAAGVAASTPAGLFITPAVMMLVGAGGSLCATLSFRFLQHSIEDQDTQGVTSLHLIPGLWGAAVMVVVTYSGIDNSWIQLENQYMFAELMPHYSATSTSPDSAITQGLITLFSLCTGLVAGAITGFIAKFMGRVALAGGYSDHVFWIVPDDFTHIGEPDADDKVM